MSHPEGQDATPPEGPVKKRMGRPPVKDRSVVKDKVLNLVLESELLARIERVWRKDGYDSRSDYIRECLRKDVERPRERRPSA